MAPRDAWRCKLRRRIERARVMTAGNSSTVVVVGLGYVGLTLSVALAQRGCRIVGLEKRQDVVDTVNAGKAHFSEAGLDNVLKAVLARCCGARPATEHQGSAK
jgi:UDP-N-acetyl-D-mannosaminuronate dehydrogenase